MPQIMASLLLEVISPKKFRADLRRCLLVAIQHGNTIPYSFIEAVVLAEDHRNEIHPGIDAIAMVRALWCRIRHGRIQGASTIEQQYVRVITNRYERTLHRKAREQLLALMLARRIHKRKIASAYLAHAYYGSGSIGIDGLKTRYGEDLSKVSFAQALQAVAQLKYPRPPQPSESWNTKISDRVDALLKPDSGVTKKYLSQYPGAARKPEKEVI